MGTRKEQAINFNLSDFSKGKNEVLVPEVEGMNSKEGKTMVNCNIDKPVNCSRMVQDRPAYMFMEL